MEGSSMLASLVHSVPNPLTGFWGPGKPGVLAFHHLALCQKYSGTVNKWNSKIMDKQELGALLALCHLLIF
jgi:hypothetical protein